jgi:hypothetical protein
MTAAEREMAVYIRALDPRDVVVLHRNPDYANLLMIESSRRSALAWSRYVPGGWDRRRDITRFFTARDRPAEAMFQVLRDSRATHVLEYVGVDFIHPEVRRLLEPVKTVGRIRLHEVRTDRELLASYGF